MACDVAGFGLESDQPPSRTLGLDLLQDLAPDELAFVELHGPAEPRLVWIDGLVHIVAPQSQRSLEARRIASAQASWKHASLLAAREDGVPNLADAVAVDEQLEAVLAGVSRPGDEAVDPRHVAMPETEVRDPVESFARQELLRARSLEGDESELKGPILDFDVRRSMVAEPPQ